MAAIPLSAKCLLSGRDDALRRLRSRGQPGELEDADAEEGMEGGGFSEVKTLLSSGNVVFAGPRLAEATVARKVEAAILHAVGKHFPVIVRSIADLQSLIDADPYRAFRLPAAAKRVVTFLRQAPEIELALPIERDGAKISKLVGRDLLSAYVVSDKGPVFMTIIERACGKDITTRTWDTVQKVARAGAG